MLNSKSSPAGMGLDTPRVSGGDCVMFSEMALLSPVSGGVGGRMVSDRQLLRNSTRAVAIRIVNWRAPNVVVNGLFIFCFFCCSPLQPESLFLEGTQAEAGCRFYSKVLNDFKGFKMWFPDEVQSSLGWVMNDCFCLLLFF